MIYSTDLMVRNMDFDSVEDKVQRDGRNGEDEAENTFPLKTRGNKRPGIPFELSPQLSSSVRVRLCSRSYFSSENVSEFM